MQACFFSVSILLYELTTVIADVFAAYKRCFIVSLLTIQVHFLAEFPLMYDLMTSFCQSLPHVTLQLLVFWYYCPGNAFCLRIVFTEMRQSLVEQTFYKQSLVLNVTSGYAVGNLTNEHYFVCRTYHVKRPKPNGPSS